MKKLLFIVMLAFGISTASAWNVTLDEGILKLAVKNLSIQAQDELFQYLGDNYRDDVHYLYALESRKKAKHSKEIHYLHLDSEFRPLATTTANDDALKAIEAAADIVRHRTQHPKGKVLEALRTIINLMCDMHNPGHVRIEGIPHSQQDFTVTFRAADMGKKMSDTKHAKWSRFWSFSPNGFTSDLWVEDIEACNGHRRAEFSKGTLNDWAAEVGKFAAKNLEEITPEAVLTLQHRNTLTQEVTCDWVARASFRLTVLLNELFK